MELGYDFFMMANATKKARIGELQQAVTNAEERMQNVQIEADELQKQSSKLDDEISTMKEQQLDITEKENAKVALEEELQAKEEQLESIKAELEQNREILEYTQAGIASEEDVETIRLYLDEAVHPIIEGIREIKAVTYEQVYGKDKSIGYTYTLQE